MMQQKIERRYILTEEEVKIALWRFLKELHDRPVPEKAEDLDVYLDKPEMFQITVDFDSTLSFTTSAEDGHAKTSA